MEQTPKESTVSNSALRTNLMGKNFTLTGISDVWKKMKRVSRSPIGSDDDTPKQHTDVTHISLRGSQFKHIVSCIQIKDSICIIRSHLYINGVPIPSGYCVNTIQGYTVSHCKYETIVDLLFVLRFHCLFSITFSRIPPRINSVSNTSVITIPQCVLFILPNYSTLLSSLDDSITQCRRTVISNHYVTLQLLNQSNPTLVLSDFLSPLDLEHFMVVDRLLLRALRAIASTPVFSTEQIVEFYHGHEQDPYFTPELGQLRLLLYQLPSAHQAELILCLRFCKAIYDQTQMFPSVEILRRICGIPDPFFASCILLTLPSLLQDPRQLWLASILLQYISHNKYYFSQHPIEVRHDRADGVISLLQACHDADDVKAILQCNASLTSTDLLYAALHLLNEGSFLHDSLLLLLTSMSHTSRQPDSMTSLQEMRCVIQLMTYEQQQALFWLTEAIHSCHSQQEALLVCSTYLSERETRDVIERFINTAIQHPRFLFQPIIPCCTESKVSSSSSSSSSLSPIPSPLDGISYPFFSLSTSFSKLHTIADRVTEVCTELDNKEIFRVSDHYVNVSVRMDRIVEWNNLWHHMI